MNNTAARTSRPRALILAVALTVGVALGGCASNGTDSSVNEGWPEAKSEFEKVYSTLQTLDAKVTTAGSVLSGAPDNEELKAKYERHRTECVLVADEYDARAADFPTTLFEDAGLPSKIDRTASETNCEG